MLRRGIRGVLKAASKQFFSEIRCTGAAPRETGPTIVVGNHPNYLFDSLVITAVFRRRLRYLAKATLFASPLAGAVLRWAGAVPVYRRQDDPALLERNEEVFRHVVEELRAGAAVVVFPEGVSRDERLLAPLKTGAARIALLAETAGDSSPGVHVQAAGITYTQPRAFRGAVTVRLSEPLPVAPFVEKSDGLEREAVTRLTARIGELLRETTVEVSDAGQRTLIEHISRLYASAGFGDDDHGRMQLVVENVAAVLPTQPAARREELEQRLVEYLDLLRRLRLDHEESLERPRDRFLSVLALPFVMLGTLVNAVPYRLTGRVARAPGDPVETATKKFTRGTAIFAAWYGLLAAAASAWSGGWVVFVVAFTFLSLLGIFTNLLFHRVRLLCLGDLRPGPRTPLAVVREVRDSLVREFDALRVR